MRDGLRRKIASRVLKVGALTIVFLVLLRWFEQTQIYFPSATLDCSGEALGRPWEEVDFWADDGIRLNGWFFPAETNSTRLEKVFLICHGNAGNISHRLDTYAVLLRTGASVFAFDYRGYGRSAGRPSETGTYRDARAALNWLVQRGFKAENILLYGESLGGGVAAEVALNAPVAGLILVSSFTSVPALGRELFPWLPVRWISSIRYDTLSKLPRIHVPVLILHSKGDTMIGFHHAESNFAAANAPKLFREIYGNHNDILDTSVEQLHRGVMDLLRLVDNPK